MAEFKSQDSFSIESLIHHAVECVANRQGEDVIVNQDQSSANKENIEILLLNYQDDGGLKACLSKQGLTNVTVIILIMPFSTYKLHTQN